MPLATLSYALVPSPIALLRHVDTPHPERGLARGLLVRVCHGVYASAALWGALPPWERYLARVHAAAIVHPDAVFALESASALVGMPIFSDPHTVHVLVPRSGTAREVAGVRTHRSSEDRTIVELGGMAMTSPADTAVDLSRHRHNAAGLAAADAVLRIDADADALLTGINVARRSSRGRRHARWPLSRATGVSESTLEVVSRAVIEWLGMPAPELQVTLRSDGVEDRPDFTWRALGAAGEADGDLKYDGRYGDARSLLRRQSIRDDRLRRHVRSVAHWGAASAAKRRLAVLSALGERNVGPCLGSEMTKNPPSHPLTGRPHRCHVRTPRKGSRSCGSLPAALRKLGGTGGLSARGRLRCGALARSGLRGRAHSWRSSTRYRTRVFRAAYFC